MTARTPIVEFRNVTFEIGGNRILDDLSFQVFAGDVLVLLGESGCGKTTTLKLINRLIDPTAGTVSVEDKQTSAWDPIELRRHIGYVLQDGGLFPHLTAGQNVGVPMTLQNRDADAINARVAEMLDLVGLEPARFRDRYPHELSGGQRQRLGVARALVSDPGLLLLDEPFGALDALTRTSLQQEFARLVSELGKTAVFVTHDLHEAMLLGTRIALMDKGKILLMDTPEGFRGSDLALARAYLETIQIRGADHLRDDVS